MARTSSGSTRTVALIGPAGAGKTTLLEAMMFASGALARQGEVAAGTSYGDSSPEARQRGQSVDLNIASFDWLGDHFTVVDCPGSTEFSGLADMALSAADIVIVVVDPHPDKAILAQPMLHALEGLGIPHGIFVNKIDQARGPVDVLVQALQGVSATPLVVRQLPLFEADRINGFVDLALERAFVYRQGQASARIDLPPEISAAETDARFHMMEQLADFDDALMEQLLNDATPDQDTLFADLALDMQQGKIAPIFLGSALNGFGVRRLLKALRHETPDCDAAARRLGLDGPAAYVVGVSYAGQAGKLAYARMFGDALHEGAELTLPDGARSRTGGLFIINGGAMRKIPSCQAGDVVAIAKVDAVESGQILSADGRARTAPDHATRAPLYALAIEARDRKDDVRLSAALSKLIEEDCSLSARRDPVSQQTLLQGQGEAHLQLVTDRLRRRFGVEATTSEPKVAYRESIRKPVTQRGRHKKQTGGHGQYGDVTLEIRPGARGCGLQFSQKIIGGAVPKQWIPSVEQGVKEALEKGPMGFPVTDLAVTLTDGAYHAVDSSEMAFRAAGRLAMNEGLPQAEPYLLEPVDRLVIAAPGVSTPKVMAAVSARRGQILGFSPKAEWSGWDDIEVYLPESQRRDFIIELRGLTQSLGTFSATFDHMAELSGRLAEEIIRGHAEAA